MLSLLLGGSKTKGVKKDYTFYVIGIFFSLTLLFFYLHFIRKIDVLPYAAISGGIFLLYIRDRFFKVEGLNMTAHLMKNAKKKQS